jgi:CheY-like chemotaxis protein
MRFEMEKWEVKVAFSAEQALEILKDYKPDAILLDIMLPKMQGDELLDILKADPKTKDIKVIILTAINFTDDMQEEMCKIANDCILKIEIMPKALVERVTKLVEGNNAKN